MQPIHLSDDPFEAPPTPEHVAHRVADWRGRLETLFSDIREWAEAHGWTVDSDAPVPMHEDLPTKVGVTQPDLPALKLRTPGGAPVWIRPKALWVVGANGRVDIFTTAGVYTLIDKAEPFEPPQWILNRAGGSFRREFTPDVLGELG